MSIAGVRQLCFARTASEIRQLLKSLVTSYEAQLDSLVDKSALARKSGVTEHDLFKCTFRALADADGRASLASTELTLPALVSENAAVRAASADAKKHLKQMWDRAYARLDVYQCLEAAQSGAQTPEEVRLVRQVIARFRQTGAALPSAEARSQLVALDARCATLAFDIEQNINEDCTEVLLAESELSGCDENFISALPMSNGANETMTRLRKCSVKAPVLLPIMKRATCGATRRKMLEASQKRCLEKNGSLLDELISKRHEAARVLGFENHAERMLSQKMAGSAKQAETFCEDMLRRILPIRDAELEQLRARKQINEGRKRNHEAMSDEHHVDVCALDAWDVSFYNDLLKREELAFDDESIKEFFPLVGTIDRILAVYSEFLGLTFERSDSLPRWHDEVVAFEVRRGNAIVGHLYLDQFPRDGKFGHQMIVPLAPSFVDSETGDRCVPACVNISNLPRPEGNRPALLRFGEMQTLFHELGHAMHCICTTSQFSLLSWAWPMVPWPGGVEQDFLEVPSMALEKFACEPALIARVARHYSETTDAPTFPTDAMGKLKALEKWMVGTFQSKFLAMALFDLKVHAQAPPYTFDGKDGLSAQELFALMVEKYTKLPKVPGTHPCASWYHLVIGYDAGYYGYLWSDVYAADIFQMMLSSPSGLLSAQTGAHFRNEILSPCATQDGGDMLRAFLGREPLPDAWCERNGIPAARI